MMQRNVVVKNVASGVFDVYVDDDTVKWGRVVGDAYFGCYRQSDDDYIQTYDDRDKAVDALIESVESKFGFDDGGKP